MNDTRILSIILLLITVFSYQASATGKQTKKTHNSTCAAEIIKGAGSRHFEIPSELCFDTTKPADKSEVVPNPPRGEKLENTL